MSDMMFNAHRRFKSYEKQIAELSEKLADSEMRVGMLKMQLHLMCTRCTQLEDLLTLHGIEVSEQ